MKLFLFAFALFCGGMACFSQVKKVYIDANNKVVATNENAVKYLVATIDSLNHEKANQKAYNMKNQRLAENNYFISNYNQDGVQRVWNEQNGQLILEEYYKNGQKEGYHREWYATGQLHCDVLYANNQMNGELKTYWPNGKLKRSDKYDMNKFVDGECFDSIGHTIPHFDYVVNPVFLNGNVSEYLERHVLYPVEAQKNGIQGKVIVQFVINKEGSLENVIVIRNAFPDLDKEAVRVVKSMPFWTPGKIDGEVEDMRFTLPVNFKLK